MQFWLAVGVVQKGRTSTEEADAKTQVKDKGRCTKSRTRRALPRFTFHHSLRIILFN